MLTHGAKFQATIEVHRMTVPQFKFVCVENGCEFGGNPDEYFQMSENSVFSCCGVPAVLVEKVNVAIWQEKAQNGRLLQTWEVVAEEPVTLGQYRSIYNAAHAAAKPKRK